MKRLFTIVALATVALWSCEKKVEDPDPDKEKEQKEEEQKEDPKPEEPTTKEVEFSASLEAFEGEAWAADSKILLFDGAAVQTLTNTAGAGAIAKFKATVPKDASAYLAYFPAGEGVTLTATSVALTLPAEGAPADAIAQKYVAKASGTMLSFRPLLGKVVYSVGREDVTKVVFEAAEKVAGNATVDYSGENPAVTAATNQLTVAGTFVPEKEYAVAVPAQAYTNVTVKVYAGEEVVDEVALENVGAIEPGKSATIPMMAIPKEPTQVYQITALKVWGGTGPEYGGTKVINLFEHPDYFNATDGRGVEAVKDNYLEIKEDIFYNYAGEDGRNWWFVYSQTVNPQTHKDLDLKEFYDVLPRSQGAFAMTVADDGTVTFTFTKEDQTQTTGTYLPAGTYDLPDGKTITIEEQAVMFELKGKDNWDYIYKDYDIIACRPRAFFIELHRLPEDFEVPEASKTVDADFVFTPEEDNPPVEFDLTTLPGKWNVYGTNTAKDAMPKFGLYVLGGSGDDPAFVSPIEKSWDWDDTIWKESDNEIVIKNVNAGTTTVTGTTNWWAGADGNFWDYIWLKTGEDLSRFYNKIPKGNTDFTLDLATMTLTWSNGTVAKVLLPGENEFVYGKKLMIPEACFALDFHLGDPIDATADRWNDVDRFVNAPLEYVVIFEKTE